MPRLDFKAIAERLRTDARRNLEEWFPAGRMVGKSEFGIGSVNGEPGKSLLVNITTGIWKDYASGIGGHDLIALYAESRKMKMSDAAKQFAGAGDMTADEIYMPGQEDPVPDHSKFGGPSHIFSYYFADGKLAGYICRFDPPNETKQFIPRTAWRRDDGTKYWRWKKWPSLSPLYRLPELLARPDAKVLIVEGEKAADYAQHALLPDTDWIVVSWCGGAKAVKATDWSPLKSRTCWIWPDADQPGLAAAGDIKRILPALNVVDIAAITPHLPEGWDLADAPIGFDVLRHMAKPAEIIVPVQQDGTVAQRLESINAEYAVILRGSDTLIMRRWMGEDAKSKLVFLTKKNFELWMDNNIVYQEEDGKTKAVKMAKSWLEWSGRQQYEDVYFEPCGREYKKRYNLWRGWSVKPNPAAACDLFLAHIRDNICQGDVEQYAWVLAWLADMFQRPNRKLGTALVLRGPMGIGKGAFANHIGQLLSFHFMPITQSGQLTGKFNGHMADKLLMFVDEGWWSDERHGTGTLRSLITEDTVTIEMKGRDAITLPNFTRFIIAANADWVVPLSGGDERRFVVLDVGVNNQRDSTYFRAMADQLKNGGYESLLHFFLHYQYDEALPRTIIKTNALLENKLDSMNHEMTWWHECLCLEKIGDFPLRNEGNNDIPAQKFYEHYQSWCFKMNYNPAPNRGLPKKIKKAVVNFNRKKKATPVGMEYYYFLQDLNDMRAHFDQFIGAKIDWDAV
jgi:hypothetical protein